MTCGLPFRRRADSAVREVYGIALCFGQVPGPTRDDQGDLFFPIIGEPGQLVLLGLLEEGVVEGLIQRLKLGFAQPLDGLRQDNRRSPLIFNQLYPHLDVDILDIFYPGNPDGEGGFLGLPFPIIVRCPLLLQFVMLNSVRKGYQNIRARNVPRQLGLEFGPASRIRRYREGQILGFGNIPINLFNFTISNSSFDQIFRFKVIQSILVFD